MLNQVEATILEWRQRPYITEQELIRYFDQFLETADKFERTDAASFIRHRLERVFDRKINKKWFEDDWLPHLLDLKGAVSGDQPLSPREVRQTMQNEAELKMNDLTVPDLPVVLIVDPDTTYQTDMKQLLDQHAVQTGIALTVQKGIELLDSMNPALVIVDEQICEEAEETVCKEARDRILSESIPLVMTIHDGKAERIAELYDSGVPDVLVKPFDKRVFVSLIQNRIRMSRMVKAQITMDDLTGAYNRNAIERELIKLHKRHAAATLKGYSVAMIRTDYPETNKDPYDYQVNDLLSVKLVEAIMREKWKQDLIGMYKGKFVLLSPEGTEQDVKAVLDRAEDTFTALIDQDDALPSGMTFSAGVAEAGEEAEPPKKTIFHAEKALRLAKRRGGRTISLYSMESKQDQVNDEIVLIIVDDDRVVREMLTHHFTKRKVIAGRPLMVKTYPDGLSFVEGDWYEKDRQFIVLLDGIMPKMDGIEALQRVRNEYGQSNIVISMLTGRKGDREVARALSLGADDYMVKPFNVREVGARLDRLFERLNAL
ncbi:response regulator receiver modulated diguanylate cyclase [[Bacillus] selenitireducens MLS10]|uniref:Response regulator receiver modulated diguanylate cyclase n=2 Tax=Salisediminibacterium selenitireducens TaxID=85683 RepID=D6XYG0_BACIE|nr:response regulator receiver modulated diguanylate cyclase [[Bacillus] selenitireducens MLS10]